MIRCPQWGVPWNLIGLQKKKNPKLHWETFGILPCSPGLLLMYPGITKKIISYRLIASLTGNMRALCPGALPRILFFPKNCPPPGIHRIGLRFVSSSNCMHGVQVTIAHRWPFRPSADDLFRPWRDLFGFQSRKPTTPLSDLIISSLHSFCPGQKKSSLSRSSRNFLCSVSHLTPPPLFSPKFSVVALDHSLSVTQKFQFPFGTYPGYPSPPLLISSRFLERVGGSLERGKKSRSLVPSEGSQSSRSFYLVEGTKRGWGAGNGDGPMVVRGWGRNGGGEGPRGSKGKTK